MSAKALITRYRFLSDLALTYAAILKIGFKRAQQPALLDLKIADDVVAQALRARSENEKDIGRHRVDVAFRPDTTVNATVLPSNSDR